MELATRRYLLQHRCNSYFGQNQKVPLYTRAARYAFSGLTPTSAAVDRRPYALTAPAIAVEHQDVGGVDDRWCSTRPTCQLLHESEHVVCQRQRGRRVARSCIRSGHHCSVLESCGGLRAHVVNGRVGAGEHGPVVGPSRFASWWHFHCATLPPFVSVDRSAMCRSGRGHGPSIGAAHRPPDFNVAASVV